MANKIGAIIALDGEKEFKSAVTSVNAELRNLRAQSGYVKEAFAGQANSIDALKAKHEVLTKVLDAQRKKEEEVSKGLENAREAHQQVGTGLEKLKKQYEEAKKQMEEMKTSSGASTAESKNQEKTVKELGRAIQQGEKNYETAAGRVNKWETSLTTAETQTLKANRALNENAKYMEEAENATDKCATSIDEFGKKTKTAATGASDTKAAVNALAEVLVAAGIAKGVKEVAGALKECVDASIEFESAITGVFKTVDGTPEQLQDISDGIKEMSRVIPASTTELAEIGEVAGQLGIATEDVLSFTEVMTNLGVTTNLSAEQAATSLARFANVAGTSSADYGRLGSVIVALGNSFATSESEIVEMSTRLASAGTLAGMTETDIMALAAAMSSVGIQAEAGGTAMTQTLTAMEKAVAGGGQKLQKFASIAGVSAKDFSNKWKTAPIEAVQLFIAGLGNLDEQGESATLVLEEMGLSGVRQSGMLKSLALASEELSSAIGMSSQAWEENTALTREAELRYGTTESKIQLFKNSVSLLQVEIGNVLNPALKNLAETGANAFEWAADIVKKAPWLVGVITGVTAALGVLTAALAGMLIVGKVTEAMKALNITLLANPYVAIAAAVVGLGTALVTLASNANEAKNESQELAEETHELAKEAKELRNSINESRSALEEGRASTEAQYGAYKTMSDRLYELNDSLKSETMSEEEAVATKVQMKAIVEKLNAEMPGLNLQIDKQNGLLKQGKETTDSYIESIKQKALVSQYEEQVTDLIETQTEAMMNAAEATLKKEEATRKEQESAEKSLAASQAYGEMTAAQEEALYKTAEAGDTLEQKIKDIAKEYEVTTDEMENGADALERGAYEQENYRNAISEAEDAIQEANEAQAEAQKEIDHTTKVLVEAGKAAGMTEEEVLSLIGVTNESTDSIQENTAATNKNNASAGESVVAAEIRKEAIESIRQKYEETTQAIESDLANQLDLFSKFDGGTDISFEAMLENMKTHTEGIEHYKENLATLSAEVGNTIAPEFMQYLEDMGLEGANMLQHMVDTMEQGNYAELFKSASDEYLQYMDTSEEIAKTGAKNKTAYETAMGELGSSKADFSGLRENIKTAIDSASEGWEKLPEKTRAELDAAVDAAQTVGAKIPEGLAESIANGEASPEDAISQLNESMRGTFDGLAEIARESGIKVPDELAAAITEGGAEAQNAISELMELMTGTGVEVGSAEMETVGAESVKGYSAGTEKESGTAQKTTENVVKKSADAAKKKATKFTGAGRSLMQAMAQGMIAVSGNVISAAGNAAANGANAGNNYRGGYDSMGANLMLGACAGMMRNSSKLAEIARQAVANALNAAKDEGGVKSPARVWRDQLGIMLTEGVAVGIKQGEKSVVSSTRNMAKASIAAAKDEFDIHSPSGVFKKFGGYISAGLGIGILNKKGYAKAASKKMAKEVYESAVSWMKEYKKTHSVSLNEEKKFWKQVAAATKKGTKEHKAALDEAGKITSFQNEIQNKLKKAFDVSWMKKGKKKTAEQYYSELTKEAKKWIDNRKSTGKVSLEQEKYFWQQVKKEAKKGTQTYADAAKKVKELNAKIKKETAANKQAASEKRDYGVSGAALESYKTYYKVSAKAEVDYWNTVRKSKGLSNTQRIEADKNYYAALESLNEQTKTLNSEYAQNVAETNAKMKEDIEDLTTAYKDAVKERKSEIISSFGLFDSFYSESVSGAQLLANLQSQVAGYADWAVQLEDLEKRGKLSKGLIEELKKMGPEASASVHALNSLTDAELAEYNSAYEQKAVIAESQAVKENEELRKQTEAKIKTIQKEAQAQINAYKKEYDSAMKELTKAIETPLKNLATKATTLGENATNKLILGIKSGATKKSTTVTLESVSSQVEKGLASLPKAGKTIGKNTLQGILDGLNNKKTIKKSAKEFVDELKDQIKKAADIHSPSRLFKKEVGVQIPAGVGEGIEEGTVKATKAGAAMISDMMSETKENLRRQQEALSAHAMNVNTGAGVGALNDLVATPAPSQTTVNVDDSALVSMMTKILAFMQENMSGVNERQLVLDTGAMVGELTEPISQSLAQITRRSR